jgi:hypothetical protein
VYLHDNEISGGGKSPDVRQDDVKALSAALGGPLPDVLYDGVVAPEIRAASKGANPAQICISNNGAFSFLNFDGGNGFKHPVNDLKPYQCSLEPQQAVVIPQLPATSASAQKGGQ